MYMNPENIIKSNIAQTIVDEMFRRAGYQVYRFGYDSVLRNLIKSRDKMHEGEGFDPLARIPDLLVVKDDVPNFIEVKFRKDGKISKSEVSSWSKGRILLVFPFPPYFKLSRVEEFVKTGKLYELDKDHFIPTEKEVIDIFIPFVEKYLKEK